MNFYKIKTLSDEVAVKSSKFFLQIANKLGIENIFGIVGGEAQAIQFDEVDAIKFYLTRHEFAAGIMAVDGYQYPRKNGAVFNFQ